MRKPHLLLGALGLALALLVPMMAAAPASANFDGAVYTTEADCTTVNGNIYANKDAVYLNGGPQNTNSNGLPADTTFYVKITDPSGTTQLSKTDGSNTITSTSEGRLPCTQLSALLYKQSDGTPGYDDTPNVGGEYKVWVSTEPDFPNDADKTDNFKVAVEPPQDLAVSKTATPSFDKTFTWGISKSVDKTRVEQIGGSATFNYTVNVTHDGGTNGNWKVAGTITVANPNADDVTGVGLTDAVDNGGTCTVTNGTGLTVPASDSLSRDYTCTYDSAPNPSAGTNTVTATWPQQTLSNGVLAAGNAVGTKAFDFSSSTPNVLDGVVDVTDTFNGTLGTLGTVSYTDASPKSFTYSRTIPVPAFDCRSYGNTARFATQQTPPDQTGSASQTVNVCGPARTGALTMGFWQNNNGQAIIKAGGPTTGTCGSTTWLRQYAPFQDLSATANCTTVAKYVYDKIKGAGTTCGGSTCNAMLKGQMLATALDVYFSDPGLGGNRINAPHPIGGVAIDLTKVCANPTACSSYINASSQFGGSPKTVSEMLTYAASQSNVGGSAWYGQVKATQVLAKDAFDAINNQVAFSA